MSDTSTRFGLSAIAQVALTVRNIPRAASFYRETLGLPLLLETPEMVFFQAGEIRLMLGLNEKEQAGPSSIVYFKVDDITAAYRELSSRGVEFTHEPRIVHRGQQTDVWLVIFRDPDQNTLALMSETARRE